MAEEKKSFVLYCDYREHLALLSDSERGQLLMAIFDYQSDGVLPNLPAAAQMAFSFIKAQLDKDADKYAQTVRQRSEAGKKSADAKKQNQPTTTNINETQETQQSPTNSNEVQQSSTSTNEAQQTATNSTDNVNVNDNVNVIYNPPLPPTGGSGGETKSDCKEAFEKFWAAYPKKTAKQQAIKAWQKLNPDKVLINAILSSLEQQKRSVQWTKDGGQFIPYPATWLTGRRWEDKLELPPRASSESSFDVSEVEKRIMSKYLKS